MGGQFEDLRYDIQGTKEHDANVHSDPFSDVLCSEEYQKEKLLVCCVIFKFCTAKNC